MKTNEDRVNESFERMKKSAQRLFDESFKTGITFGITILATELLESQIDDIPFPSRLVKEVADRLLEEIIKKKEKR